MPPQSNDSGKIPLVSVIIPCFNCSQFIARAIESAINQTYPDFEILVVDDGSTDDLSTAIQEFRHDPRMRVITLSKNKGPSSARNSGIQAANGMLIAFLDADDKWLPEKLAKQVEIFINQDAKVCCVAAYSHFSNTVFINREPMATDKNKLYKELLFRNIVPGSSSSIMVDRQCFTEVGLFDETMFAAEDRDMWIRLAAKYDFKYVNVPLAEIDRSREDSSSKNPDRMAEGYDKFLDKREQDIPDQFRHLLPRARRYAYLRIAKIYYDQKESTQYLTYAKRGLKASLFPDAQLRRALRFIFEGNLSRVFRRNKL